MIRIENLSKDFSGKCVLENINFTIRPGQVTAIIGASGAGKSTLLRTINALERAGKGTVSIGDFVFDHAAARTKDVIGLRRRTAMVFQHFNLFRRKTALGNVMEGLTTVRGFPASQARFVALQQLEKVGLAGYGGHYPQHLSGGQQQRVAIARAVAMFPQLLLLDEPTSALDPELVAEVLEVIRQVASERTTLLVSHEMDFVRQVADRVLFMDDGRIVESGSVGDIFERPRERRTREFLSTYYRVRNPEYDI